MVKYAIIDKNNVCIGCAELSGEVDVDNYIKLKDGETVPNGYVWIDKTWEEGEFPTTEPEPTQLDRMEEMLNKSHEEIKNEAIDEYTSMLMEEGVL